MQYFPGYEAASLDLRRQAEDATTKSELLFYLVTGRFAHRLCRSRAPDFALECQRGFRPSGLGTEVLKMSPYKFHIISS